jgi:hypothetical protein
MSFSLWQIILTGIAVGVLYFLLTYLIGHYVIESLYCGSNVNVENCSNSTNIAGNIATILSGTVGLGVMIGLRVLRPIIVAVATAVLLWGLSAWTAGLSWGEALLWSALLYALSYVLFAWICRYNRTMPIIIVAIIISVVARIFTSV